MGRRRRSRSSMVGRAPSPRCGPRGRSAPTMSGGWRGCEIAWGGAGGGAALGGGGELAAAIASAEAEVQRCEAELRRHAVAAGLGEEPGVVEIEAASEAIQRARSHRLRWEDLSRDLQERERRHL